MSSAHDPLYRIISYHHACLTEHRKPPVTKNSLPTTLFIFCGIGQNLESSFLEQSKSALLMFTLGPLGSDKVQSPLP